MNGAGHQFFSRTALAGDQHRGASIFQARDHAEDVLDFRRGADYAVELRFRVDAVAQELVLFHQLDFFRHATEEEPQFLEWREGLADVVVGAQLHGLHGSFNGAVASHDRDFGAGQQFLYFFQKLQTGHLRHHHIGENHVGRLFFEQRHRRLSAVGLGAQEAERLPYRHAELADALLVIHYQQANSQIFAAHNAFPIVFSTTEINCRTRKGFSTQGAPVLRSVSTVSSLAMSPVMNTIREASSGRLRATQAWTSAPLTPPGVRISETTPRKLPDSSSRSASAPDSLQTTE